MGTVYELKLYQVTVELCGEVYNVEAGWTVKQSPMVYEGEYLVKIIGNDVTAAEKTVSGQCRDVSITGVALDPDTNYSICISVKEKPEIVSEELLLLKTYENVTVDYDGKDLFLKWVPMSWEIGEGQCRILPKLGGNYVYDIPAYNRGIHISFDEEIFGAEDGFRVILTPYITNISAGPQVVLQDISRPDYVSGESDTLQCRCGRREKEVITRVLHASPVFKETVPEEASAETVVYGPLSLSKTEPYTLSVDTSQILERTEYDSFISECYQCVTPGAMYEILDFIARSATQRTEDMLYYSCGFSESRRCADIRPGYSIQVEQAVYQYQNEMDEGNVSGFIGNNIATYKVSLQAGQEMEYLEFDSFVSMFEEELYVLPYSETRQSASGKPQQTGARVLDLCSVNTRSSYYRIQYPEAMFVSDVLPDTETGNHVFLLGEPGWEKIPDPTAPYLLFRGRTAITLLFTITVNAREEYVPAGTTLGKLLRQKGIYCPDFQTIRIFRRNPYGREACLRNPADHPAFFEKLPLMHGDRIEM